MVKEARLESLQSKTRTVFFPKLSAQNEQQVFLILNSTDPRPGLICRRKIC